MTPKDCFAVAVRVIGLVVAIGGLRYLLSAAFAVFHSPQRSGIAPAIDYLIPGVLGVLLGFYLIRGGPLVIRLAFPSKKTGEQTASEV